MHLAASKEMSATSSFTTERLNRSTWVIREDDVYEEHPLVYVKVHPKVPVLVVSDTGCDEPSEKHKEGKRNSAFLDIYNS